MADLAMSGVTIDAADPDALAAWWAEALGWKLDGRRCRSLLGGPAQMEFMAVPEAKAVKNRVHVDFGTTDVEAALIRLVELGATVAWEEEILDASGYRNVVLRDPEGNEFCVGGPPPSASNAPHRT